MGLKDLMKNVTDKANAVAGSAQRNAWCDKEHKTVLL